MILTLSIIDKLYSDTKTLTIVYVIGCILLLFFIIMLFVSIKSKDDKEIIIDDPIEGDNDTKDTDVIYENTINTYDENNNVDNKIESEKENDTLSTDDIFEKTTMIDLDSTETDPVDNYDDDLKTALDIADNKEIIKDKDNIDEIFNNVLINQTNNSSLDNNSVSNEIEQKQNDLKAKLDNLRKNN